MALVTTVTWLRSLAQELWHAAGTAGKTKNKTNKQTKKQLFQLYLQLEQSGRLLGGGEISAGPYGMSRIWLCFRGAWESTPQEAPAKPSQCHQVVGAHRMPHAFVTPFLTASAKEAPWAPLGRKGS